MKKTVYFFICAILTLSALEGSLNSIDRVENRKKALIFGATGQDGTYLTEFLLSHDYEVHGVARHISPAGTLSPQQFNDNPNYFFHIGDVTNFSNIVHLVGGIKPDEIYNLAAQSGVKVSFDHPEDTADINALGTLRILEGIRMMGLEKKTKLFQASSSELYGLLLDEPRTENTPFYPRSPYGVAKLYGYWITVNYRESYEIFACNGILFNHESPLRGESFVTRKITRAVCRYKLGSQEILYLGNLDAKRDWGYAKDYVEAMWLMLQQDKPDDYVIATGETHSVREFVELAFNYLGIEIDWHGHGAEEYGLDKKTGKIIVKVDPGYYRPNEVEFISGKPEKAEKMLKWKSKTSFSELVKIMVDEDLKIALQDKQI